MVARPAGAAKLVDMAAAVEIIEERARRKSAHSKELARSACGKKEPCSVLGEYASGKFPSRRG